MTVISATRVDSMDIFTNFTLDDNSMRFQYLPENSWTLGSTPFVQLDTSQVLGGTWHDTTGNPQDPSSREIHLNFTAVYVFCVIANQSPPEKTFDTFADYKFLIDDVVVGEFRHEAEDTTEYFYNTPVYVNTSLPNKEHHFTMLIDSVDRPVLMLFDYLVYTTMQTPYITLPSTTPSTVFPSFTTMNVDIDVPDLIPPLVANIISAVTSFLHPVIIVPTSSILTTSFVTSFPTITFPTSQYSVSPVSQTQFATIAIASSATTTPAPASITSYRPSPSLGLDKNISTVTGNSDDTVVIVGGTLGSVVFFILATIVGLLTCRTNRAPVARDGLKVWRLWRRYCHLMPLPFINRSRVYISNPEDPTTGNGPPPYSALEEVLVQQRGTHICPPITPTARDLNQSLTVAVSNPPATPAITVPYSTDATEQTLDDGPVVDEYNQLLSTFAEVRRQQRELQGLLDIDEPPEYVP